jgi:hypothetical protein
MLSACQHRHRLCGRSMTATMQRSCRIRLKEVQNLQYLFLTRSAMTPWEVLTTAKTEERTLNLESYQLVARTTSKTNKSTSDLHRCVEGKEKTIRSDPAPTMTSSHSAPKPTKSPKKINTESARGKRMRQFRPQDLFVKSEVHVRTYIGIYPTKTKCSPTQPPSLRDVEMRPAAQDAHRRLRFLLRQVLDLCSRGAGQGL